jgi:PBSX family phage terminase large subunit
MLLNEFVPHPGQKLVLESPRRFIATISGVQGGKTTVGAIWLLAELYKDYENGIQGDYLIVAPTNKLLQQSTLVKFKELMPSDWGVYKEQKQVYELKWGGKIFVRSAEDPNLLEGMTLRAAWADEAGQMKASVWTVLQARVAVQKGRILMTSTPYAQNWYYRDIFKQAGWLNSQPVPDKNPDIEIVSWGSTVNPAFPTSEMERAKAGMTAALYERRYCGVFTQLEGLVYPFTDDCIVDPFGINPQWQHFGGMDFGQSDPTVVLDIVEDPVSHVYYIIDEYYKAGSLLKNAADWIGGHALTRVLADPQSAQLINELRNYYGLGQVTGAEKSTIQVGIERITMLLKEGRLKVFRHCKNVIEEFEMYHHKIPDPDKVQTDEPVDKDNHAMDALRYAFSKPLEGVYFKRQAEIKKGRKGFRPLVTRKSWEQALNSQTGY